MLILTFINAYAWLSIWLACNSPIQWMTVWDFFLFCCSDWMFAVDFCNCLFALLLVCCFIHNNFFFLFFLRFLTFLTIIAILHVTPITVGDIIRSVLCCVYVPLYYYYLHFEQCKSTTCVYCMQVWSLNVKINKLRVQFDWFFFGDV